MALREVGCDGQRDAREKGAVGRLLTLVVGVLPVVKDLRVEVSVSVGSLPRFPKQLFSASSRSSCMGEGRGK